MNSRPTSTTFAALTMASAASIATDEAFRLDHAERFHEVPFSGERRSIGRLARRGQELPARGLTRIRAAALLDLKGFGRRRNSPQ